MILDGFIQKQRGVVDIGWYGLVMFVDLVGAWPTPSEKYESMGRMTSHILWEKMFETTNQWLLGEATHKWSYIPN